ncbi:Methylglyoxal synthase [Gracilariopsis chorda]|uniref:Methylglyoxal synthase n=1 Tax=Gracilariopsis chorda TaxID=448386 RepID=A0A2V3IUI2_9FLOR|nr:Methylglyoxal synthase [Gracilariopsis chorda]|eukprot:PXF45739.1 Methylglyoxal synthase [Gracilariopsis chorda]
MVDMVDAMLISEFRASVPIKDRRHHLIKYKNCFVGSEAVDWLVAANPDRTREEAVKIGEQMRKMGLFHHVHLDHDFKDKRYFYAFNDKVPLTMDDMDDMELDDDKKGIALIAHNNFKGDLIEWAQTHKNALSKHKLVATGTTGSLIKKATGLNVDLMKSGPLGGDQQIGALVAEQTINVLIFFWDPLTAQPHDSDVKALLRLAVLCNAAIAMNTFTADLLISAISGRCSE